MQQSHLLVDSVEFNILFLMLFVIILFVASALNGLALFSKQQSQLSKIVNPVSFLWDKPPNDQTDHLMVSNAVYDTVHQRSTSALLAFWLVKVLRISLSSLVSSTWSNLRVSLSPGIRLHGHRRLADTGRCRIRRSQVSFHATSSRCWLLTS